MKKRTLEQLEDDLFYYESFLKEYMSVIEGHGKPEFTMSFGKHGERKLISYEEMQSYALDERYELAKKIQTDAFWCDEDDTIKAIRVLYVLGFRDLAFAVHKVSAEHAINKDFSDKINEIKRQVSLKKVNSKGGKNRTSRHKNTALQIASATWGKVPRASMESLSRKIYEHLSKKYRDTPEPGTIKTWLRASGLNPDQLPKIKDYELVIK
ncbi:hypothetical protein [Citrobacter amalonaticus]|uniref:hypothetical protein n=1 Tax=Citrobacter amalonaticus TaxID=35703 RepID=UPI001A2917EA|nr:hypothetical protein [Citrobacter koseri]HCB1825098.1 hypothetical protein [Citrobacter amalonaticus]HCB1899742.1 hypothetical protein [Citrobacter amalonaticus]